MIQHRWCAIAGKPRALSDNFEFILGHGGPETLTNTKIAPDDSSDAHLYDSLHNSLDRRLENAS